MLAHFCLFYFFMCVQRKRENKLSCNQPAQQAFLCRLGAKNQEQESKTARKMAQVKERGRGCPSPAPPPSFIFWFSFYFSRGQNRKSPSTVFFCSETKRKRLLRRLSCNRMGKSVFVFHIFESYVELSCFTNPQFLSRCESQTLWRQLVLF